MRQILQTKLLTFLLFGTLTFAQLVPGAIQISTLSLSTSYITWTTYYCITGDGEAPATTLSSGQLDWATKIYTEYYLASSLTLVPVKAIYFSSISSAASRSTLETIVATISTAILPVLTPPTTTATSTTLTSFSAIPSVLTAAPDRTTTSFVSITSKAQAQQQTTPTATTTNSQPLGPGNSTLTLAAAGNANSTLTETCTATVLATTSPTLVPSNDNTGPDKLALGIGIGIGSPLLIMSVVGFVLCIRVLRRRYIVSASKHISTDDGITGTSELEGSRSACRAKSRLNILSELDTAHEPEELDSTPVCEVSDFHRHSDLRPSSKWSKSSDNWLRRWKSRRDDSRNRRGAEAETTWF